MPAADTISPKIAPRQTGTLCYHCGTPCLSQNIHIEEKVFCCDGCLLVYELLNDNGLCDYYKLEHHPGLSQVRAVRSDKFAFLENGDIAASLYAFTDGNHTIVTLYIPSVHCSSCMWLLEHLDRLHEGITESRLNFSTKEVTIRFQRDKINLRQLADLLTTVGYEPYITLSDTEKKQTGSYTKKRLYKLGVAGFCFGNIMMMSLPEYFSAVQQSQIDHQYALLFRMLNLLLSLPVFFYSASEFWINAWKGLQQKMLNIDAPVALAILITFSRSVYEIASGTGSGYLDSMTGIVFFMLVGRVVQERTYRSLSFHRDYKSYFPVAVNVQTKNGLQCRSLNELQVHDLVVLSNEELVPADAVVISGNAQIDYSFVTGESLPAAVPVGEKIYAGGRQTGGSLTIKLVKPVAGSYLTSLWNHHAFARDKAAGNDRKSVVHTLSKYFTWLLLLLAAVTAGWWWVHDTSRILPAVSSILIVACPCALLLAATYTNGNLLRIFSNNGLYLRDATVIEQLGNADSIVFDKTGTLTHAAMPVELFYGVSFSTTEKQWLYSMLKPSKHPYSKALTLWTGVFPEVTMDAWMEIPGQGIEAVIDGVHIRVGNAAFTNVSEHPDHPANVYIRMQDKIAAFHFTPEFREGTADVVAQLQENYELALLSGDNSRQETALRAIFGMGTQMLFAQKPKDKLHYIAALQQKNKKVIMIGDGLNDAGALQQSNAGIAVADNINNFTPSCDAIMDAAKFKQLPALLKMARSGRSIITAAFIVSIIYNIIGLSFAVRGVLNPMIAAVLMPLSTLSIVLISTGASTLRAKMLHLAATAKA
jgi:Cu+-exporting ATPase